MFAAFSTPPLKLQVAPGAALLMRILEDFIHLIGEAQKPFQSFLVVTNNLSKFLVSKVAFRLPAKVRFLATPD